MLKRRALGQAAQIAGIELKGMIGEPSAAALYWWSTHKRDQKILVYCQGAGFTDVSLFDISGRKMTVLASESGRIGGNSLRHEISDTVQSDHASYGEQVAERSDTVDDA